MDPNSGNRKQESNSVSTELHNRFETVTLAEESGTTIEGSPQAELEGSSRLIMLLLRRQLDLSRNPTKNGWVLVPGRLLQRGKSKKQVYGTKSTRLKEKLQSQ